MLTMPLKTMLSIIAIVLTLSASNHFHYKNPARIKAPYKTTIGVQEFYTQLADAVSNDNIVDILTYLESQGVRDANGADNNASLNVVREWLVAKLESYGYAVQLHDAGIFGDNIVIEKTGTEFPDNKIVVGGHYDSVAGGPGINDNGSGIAALLEIARILSDFNTKKSLIIIFFTGEEDGFQGSRIWAQEASANNMQIDLMFNLDMFGGISNRNGEPYTMTSITCERDEGNSTATNDAASWAVTDTLAMFTNTYTSIDAVIDYAYSSDYMVFEQEGYVITGYYEYVPEGNPYYHRATDILSNMDVDYLYQAVRGAVTFTAHMARTIDKFLSVSHDPLGIIEIVDAPVEVQARVATSANISSAMLYWSPDSITFSPLAMTLHSEDDDELVYTADVPGQAVGADVYYYFDFANEDNISSRLPENGTFKYAIRLDTTGPQLSVESPSSVSIHSFPLELIADAEDEQGVAEVLLHYKINDGDEISQAMTIEVDGKYHASWQPDIEHGDVLNYKIIARDQSANGNESFYPVDGSFAELVIYNAEFHNFEVYPATFALNGDWEWGQKEAFDPVNPFSGVYFVATGIGRNYSHNTHSEMVSPVISFLDDIDDLRLYFKHYYATENNDGGNVKIAADFGDWELIEPVAGYPNNNNYALGEPGFSGNSYYWQEAEFDLSAYENATNIQFKVTFASDFFNASRGWYIDDFELRFAGNGGFTSIDENAISNGVAQSFELLRVYPNPFNPATKIEYRINQPGQVALTIYNLRGQRIDYKMVAHSGAGSFTQQWQAEGVATGLYIVDVSFKGRSMARQKVLLIK
jgi:aminopeptidase YwaD